jgi:hypothetical protein
MFYRQEILRIIGESEERSSYLDEQRIVSLPDRDSDKPVSVVINELLQEGYLETGDEGNVYSLGSAGIRISLVLTRKGQLFYDRYYRDIGKDSQILDLNQEGFTIAEIARLVDASEAYIKILLTDSVLK